MTTRVISVTVDGRTTTVRATDPGRVLNVGPSGGGGGEGTVTSVNEVEPVDGDITLTPDDFTDGTTNHVFTATDDTKLAGIATGATANSTDATLLARANHTGSQAISTVTGLQTALDGKETAGAAAAAQAASQPLDSDLTAIAALSTTSFGRALLALADAAAGRTALGLGTAAVAATGDFDAAGAAAAAQAASQPLDSDLTSIAALSTTSYGRGFLALADAAAGRTALGLGTAATSASTDFQPVDSDLTSIAALTTTSFGRSLLEAANASGLRTLAGLVLGTDIYSKSAVDAGFQPLDSDLTSIAALSTTSIGRSLLAGADAAALRTILALGTTATVNTGTSSGDVALLSTGGRFAVARLGSGTPDGTKFLRDDGAFATPAGGASGLTATATKTSNYTAAANDLVIADVSAGSFTVTLKASPSTGDRIAVKRVDFSAGILTVTPTSGNIDGAASRKMYSQHETVDLLYTGSEWTVVNYHPGKTRFFDDFSGSGIRTRALTGHGYKQYSGGLAGLTGGHWAASSGSLVDDTTGGTSERWVLAEVGVAVSRIKTKIAAMWAGGDGGVFFRYGNVGDAGLYLNAESGSYILYTRNSSGFTSLGTIAAVAPAANDVLEIADTGAAVTLTLNGVVKSTISTTYTGGTHIGFRHNGASSASLAFDYLIAGDDL